MLATLVKANPDTFDALLLIAVIFFLIGAIWSAIDKSITMTILFVGLFFEALAFMFLS